MILHNVICPLAMSKALIVVVIVSSLCIYSSSIFNIVHRFRKISKQSTVHFCSCYILEQYNWYAHSNVMKILKQSYLLNQKQQCFQQCATDSQCKTQEHLKDPKRMYCPYCLRLSVTLTSL